MIHEGKFQIGKNGLNAGVIITLNTLLKNHNRIRISLLKNATRDKKRIKEIADEIIKKVEYRCSYRIIGFTIILKRLSSRVKFSKTKSSL